MQNEFVILGTDVVGQARGWIDTPFIHQAAVRGRGCDCIGLIRGIGAELEIMDFDPASDEGRAMLAYGRDPEPRRLIGALNRWFVRVDHDVQPGDVILFTIDNQHSHVGIIANVDKGVVIHTWLRSKKVVESTYHSNLKPAGTWRYPGVAHPQGEWL